MILKYSVKEMTLEKRTERMHCQNNVFVTSNYSLIYAKSNERAYSTRMCHLKKLNSQSCQSTKTFTSLALDLCGNEFSKNLFDPPPTFTVLKNENQTKDFVS